MSYEMSTAGIQAAVRNGDYAAAEQIRAFLRLANDRREKSEGKDFDGDGNIGKASASSFVGRDEFGGRMSYDTNGDWRYEDQFGGVYDKWGYNKGNTFYGNGGISYERGSNTIKINGQEVAVDIPHNEQDLEWGAKYTSLWERVQNGGKNPPDPKKANERPAGGLTEGETNPATVQAGVLTAQQMEHKYGDPARAPDHEVLDAFSNNLLHVQVMLNERLRVKEALERDPNDDQAKRRKAELDALSKLPREKHSAQYETLARRVLSERLEQASEEDRKRVMDAVRNKDGRAIVGAVKQVFNLVVATDNSAIRDSVAESVVSGRQQEALPAPPESLSGGLVFKKTQSLPTGSEKTASASAYISGAAAGTAPGGALVAELPPVQDATEKKLEARKEEPKEEKDEVAGIADPKLRERVRELEMKRLEAELKLDPGNRDAAKQLQELKDMDSLPVDKREKALIKLSNRVFQERWDALSQADKEALAESSSSMDPKVFGEAINQMFARTMPAPAIETPSTASVEKSAFVSVSAQAEEKDEKKAEMQRSKPARISSPSVA